MTAAVVSLAEAERLFSLMNKMVTDRKKTVARYEYTWSIQKVRGLGSQKSVFYVLSGKKVKLSLCLTN
jgi:hypothetical protein